MNWRCETIRNLNSGREALGARRHGVIETACGELRSIHLRPWPKVLSLNELWPMGSRYHGRGSADRCWLYFNQPRSMPDFLALKYVISTDGTSYRTFRAALVVLDAI